MNGPSRYAITYVGNKQQKNNKEERLYFFKKGHLT